MSHLLEMGIRNYCLVVLILMSVHRVTSQPLPQRKDCSGYNFYNLLAPKSSTPGLISYFPKGSVENWCTDISKTLQCLRGQSSEIVQLFLMTQEAQITYICQHRGEYAKSKTCFLTTGLMERIKLRCMQNFNVFDCKTVEKVASCVRELIPETDECKETDADLMVTLARLFFQPIREMRNCPALNTTSPTTTSTTVQSTLGMTSPQASASSYYPPASAANVTDKNRPTTSSTEGVSDWDHSRLQVMKTTSHHQDANSAKKIVANSSVIVLSSILLVFNHFHVIVIQ